MTPQEDFTKKQSEIFEESQAKFRNLYKEIELALSKLEAQNKLAKDKMDEVAGIKQSATSLEKTAEAKFKEATQLMEKAVSTKSQASEEEARITKLKAEHAKTDAALSAQRDELMAREQAVIQNEKIIDMKERKLKFERRKIDKLIEDAAIQEELKKEMLRDAESES